MHASSLRRALAGFKPDAADVWRYRDDLEELAAHLFRRDGGEGQDPIVAAGQYVDGFEGEATIRLWLHAVVGEESRRIARRRPGRSLDTYLDAVVHARLRPDHPVPKGIEEELTRRLRLLDSLAGLPPNYRCALMLRAGEGLSTGSIARATATTPASVRSVLYRARAMLRP